MNTQQLKEELQGWQEHYSDPADKNNYDFFTALIAAVDRLEAAERDRDELRHSDYLMWHAMACKNGERAKKAEAEIARRDVAASEPVGLQFMGDSGKWQDCASREVAESLGFTQFRELYTAAPPAVLPPKYADELNDRAELIEAYSKTQCEIAQELGCDSDNESILKAIYELKALGAQPQKPVALPESVRINNGYYFNMDDIFAALDAANVPWR